MSVHEAARSGDVVELTRLLTAGGLDPNCRDRLSRTPLHLAAYQGQQHAVECLLALGANPRLAAADDTTALHFAAQRGHLAVVKCLLKQGGLKVDTPTRKGCTALHFAALHAHHPIVRFLLARKANPLRKNSKNQTPQDLAAAQLVKDEFEASAQRRQDLATSTSKKSKTASETEAQVATGLPHSKGQDPAAVTGTLGDSKGEEDLSVLMSNSAGEEPTGERGKFVEEEQ